MKRDIIKVTSPKAKSLLLQLSVIDDKEKGLLEDLDICYSNLEEYNLELSTAIDTHNKDIKYAQDEIKTLTKEILGDREKIKKLATLLIVEMDLMDKPKKKSKKKKAKAKVKVTLVAPHDLDTLESRSY